MKTRMAQAGVDARPGMDAVVKMDRYLVGVEVTAVVFAALALDKYRALPAGLTLTSNHLTLLSFGLAQMVASSVVIVVLIFYVRLELFIDQGPISRIY